MLYILYISLFRLRLTTQATLRDIVDISWVGSYAVHLIVRTDTGEVDSDTTKTTYGLGFNNPTTVVSLQYTPPQRHSPHIVSESCMRSHSLSRSRLTVSQVTTPIESSAIWRDDHMVGLSRQTSLWQSWYLYLVISISSLLTESVCKAARSMMSHHIVGHLVKQTVSRSVLLMSQQIRSGSRIGKTRDMRDGQRKLNVPSETVSCIKRRLGGFETDIDTYCLYQGWLRPIVHLTVEIIPVRVEYMWVRTSTTLHYRREQLQQCILWVNITAGDQKSCQMYFFGGYLSKNTSITSHSHAYMYIYSLVLVAHL